MERWLPVVSPFAEIATAASRNDVAARMRSAIRQRHHMILGQLALSSLATVSAAMFVSRLQLKPLGSREVINWSAFLSSSPSGGIGYHNVRIFGTIAALDCQRLCGVRAT